MQLPSGSSQQKWHPNLPSNDISQASVDALLCFSSVTAGCMLVDQNRRTLSVKVNDAWFQLPLVSFQQSEYIQFNQISVS